MLVLILPWALLLVAVIVGVDVWARERDHARQGWDRAEELYQVNVGFVDAEQRALMLRNMALDAADEALQWAVELRAERDELQAEVRELRAERDRLAARLEEMAGPNMDSLSARLDDLFDTASLSATPGAPCADA